LASPRRGTYYGKRERRKGLTGGVSGHGGSKLYGSRHFFLERGSYDITEKPADSGGGWKRLVVCEAEEEKTLETSKHQGNMREKDPQTGNRKP